MKKNHLLLKASVRALQTWGAHDSSIREILAIPTEMLDNAGNTEDYEPELTAEQAMRMAHVCRIYVDISRAFGEPTAQQWGGNTNMNKIFGGRTPLSLMESEGLEGIQKALAYVSQTISPA